MPILTVVPAEICFGDTVQLSNLVTSSPLITHQFYTVNPALNASAPITSTFVQPTENTVIYIISTDTDPAKQTSCTTTSEVLIKVNPLPTLDIPTQEICVGTSLDIALQNLNGMSATYHSTKNQTEIGVVTLPSTEIEFANTGSFSYFARIVDTTTNCWNVEEIKIQVNPLPTLTVTNTEICVGESINLSSLTNTDSSNRLDYFTSLADAQNDQNKLSSLSVSPLVSTDYFVKATDVTNTTYCSSIETLSITVNPLPTVTVVSKEICFGDIVELGSLVSADPSITHKFYTSDPLATSSSPITTTYVRNRNTVIYIINWLQTLPNKLVVRLLVRY